jgi:TolB-like protein
MCGNSGIGVSSYFIKSGKIFRFYIFDIFASDYTLNHEEGYILRRKKMVKNRQSIDYSILLVSSIFIFLIFLPNCAGPAKQSLERQLFENDRKCPRRLAILPFDNNSVTDPDQYDPLSKGLATMLLTDLKLRSGGLMLIERTRINALLQEMELGQTGMINDSTATKIGRILGADGLAFGSFMILNDQVRIDARLVKVETAEVILAQSVQGGKDELIALQSELSDKLAKSLKVNLSPPTVEAMGNMDAALVFSKGVQALDAGNMKEAQELFDTCIRMDPSYQANISSLTDK